jgi:hypothetical protein
MFSICCPSFLYLDCCRNDKCSRATMRRKQHEIGIQRMNKELDLRTFIRKLRTVEFISSLILTRTQRLLINKTPDYKLTEDKN